MKKDIHPQTYNDCTVTCACGNSFTTQSTKPSISVDICSMCHPFYTGTQKLIDTEGRIEKFTKRVKFAQSRSAVKSGGKKDKRKNLERKSLKDLLKESSDSKTD